MSEKTTPENPWQETVRSIFDMLMLSTEQASELECRILDLIESRHHDYFCVGMAKAGTTQPLPEEGE